MTKLVNKRPSVLVGPSIEMLEQQVSIDYPLYT